jgi:preprotein translocase subunit SecF
MKENFKKKLIQFHDKNYKKLLILPLFLILFCFGYLFFFYSQTNEFFYKDISLQGGTSVTINEEINSVDLQNAISGKLENVNIREISDLITQKNIAIIVETSSIGCNESEVNQIKSILEDFLGYELNSENSSFECTGSTLSENFYQQLLIALLISFSLMAVVIFIQFKSIVPSLAVIFSAFADILMSLVLVDILGIRISSAGIVALVMLIGYSVDTDILLTNKVLKRGGDSLNKRIFSSFGTGITMTLTSLFAVIIADLIVGQFSSILHQIFLIMAIGLSFDILNTWLTNVSIIKWYALKKK